MEYVSTLDMCDAWASDDDDEQQSMPPPQKAPPPPPPPATATTDSLPDICPTTFIAAAAKSPPPIAASNTPSPTKAPGKSPLIPAAAAAATPKKSPTTTTGSPGAAAAPNAPPFYIPPPPSDLDEVIFGQEIRSGANFNKISSIPVRVSGEQVPTAFADFATSGLAAALLDNIGKSGYTMPTPIQRHGISAVMAGRDVMACAQTGSGKTAAYLLGILQRLLTGEPRPMRCGRPQALVITPTRELAVQIFNETRKFARGTYLKACVLYGGTSTGYQWAQLQKGCHVLVATPGRLLDLVDDGRVEFGHVAWVVLDEADRMMDMGFMPEVQRIVEHRTMAAAGQRQTLMFSATFPGEIQELAGRLLDNYIFIAVGIVGSASSDVQQTVLLARYLEKRERLLQLLDADETEEERSGDGSGGGGTMVFVETRRQADFLASFLSENDYPTTSMHGERYQWQREQALADFKAGTMRVLICTSVAARGLNIKNVKHVINYDMPPSVDDYVHRIGRTGRIGNRGRATSFFDPDMDSALAADLLKILDQADQPIPDFLLKLARTSGNAPQRTEMRINAYGGIDVRKARRNPARPTGHEPLEMW